MSLHVYKSVSCTKTISICLYFPTLNGPSRQLSDIFAHIAVFSHLFKCISSLWNSTPFSALLYTRDFAPDLIRKSETRQYGLTSFFSPSRTPVFFYVYSTSLPRKSCASLFLGLWTLNHQSNPSPYCTALVTCPIRPLPEFLNKYPSGKS